MTAKTENDRIKAFRQRQKEAGLKELRNLWAYPEDHEPIKLYAAKLTAKRTTKGQK